MFATSLWLPLSAWGDEPLEGKDFLLKVNVTTQAYDYFQPWQKHAPQINRGIGVVLEGKHILVTAQLVANASSIELEKPETGEKTQASLSLVDYEANLALLEAGDKSFLKGWQELALDTEVSIGDELTFWQIEQAGVPVATNGKLVRADMGPYFLTRYHFLFFQAAVSLQYRPNSFTFPVTRDGKLVGLLLSYDQNSQLADILASPIIDHFLRDGQQLPYGGFPRLGIAYTQMLDAQFREYLGIDADLGGVYLSDIAEDSPADKAGIEPGDIIVSIGGHALDRRGYFSHPRYGKIRFTHLIKEGFQVGDALEVEIWRKGERLQKKVVLERKAPEEYLVPPYEFDRAPDFLLTGGLLFQELTLSYLKTWGSEWKSKAPFQLRYWEQNQEDWPHSEQKRIVLLTRVFANPAVVGFENLSNLIVTEVNDRPIYSLRDVQEALQTSINGFHQFEFSEEPTKIFLEKEAVVEVDRQMQQLYGLQILQRIDEEKDAK